MCAPAGAERHIADIINRCTVITRCHLINHIQYVSAAAIITPTAEKEKERGEEGEKTNERGKRGEKKVIEEKPIERTAVVAQHALPMSPMEALQLFDNINKIHRGLVQLGGSTCTCPWGHHLIA